MKPSGPDEPFEVGMIEDLNLANVDFTVEAEGGGVVMTLDASDVDVDWRIFLTPEKARALGELLFTQSYAQTL